MTIVTRDAQIECLIPRADTNRPFGCDPMQAAIGKLPPSAVAAGEGSHYGLKLDQAEYVRITRCLLKAAAQCETKRPVVEARKPGYATSAFAYAHQSYLVAEINGSKIAYEAAVKYVPSRNAVRRPGYETAEWTDNQEFLIDITCANRRTTEMHVRTQKDHNGNFWVNLRANPTTLIIGYNALGIAFKGLNRTEERALLMQVPFVVLAAVLRGVTKEFEWTPPTAKRIEALQFKLCPIQIFTGLPTGDFTPAHFLGFLRAALLCPFGDGDKSFGVLADLLGVTVESRLVAGEVQTLLLKFVRNGRIELSVNLYDKNAKAKVDAAVVRLVVADDERVLDFLSNSVRADITLHDGALRDVMAEAGLGTKDSLSLTGENFNRAVRRLELGQGRSKRLFVQWLLTYIFDERLPLMRLLTYRPSLIAEAQRALAAYNGEAARVFAEAVKLGFVYKAKTPDKECSLSFVQFAGEKLKSRQRARTMRAKLLAVGLDPDIPRAACELLYSISHVWNLPPGKRIAFNRAIEAGRFDTVAALMKDSRARSKHMFEDVRTLLGTMIATAHVPAITVKAAKHRIGG